MVVATPVVSVKTVPDVASVPFCDENFTGAPCRAKPCELVTNAVKVIVPPLDGIVDGFAWMLMSVAASRIVTSCLAASLEPKTAETDAVPA